MQFDNHRRHIARFVAVSMTCLTITATMASVASANVGLCSPRLISANIKEAVLALKATEHCAGTQLPYNHDQATARLDDLRCGKQASDLIDDMVKNYEREYRTILRTDAGQVVCKHAATITFD